MAKQFKNVDDAMYIVMRATASAKKLSLDVFYAFADILIPDEEAKGEVSLNGNPIRSAARNARSKLRDLLRDQWEINRMFYVENQASHRRDTAMSIAMGLLKKEFPEGVKNVSYPDDGLIFSRQPVKNAKQFFVEIVPRGGPYGIWGDIYPTKEFGVVDMDAIPEGVRPYVANAKKIYASCK